MRITIVDQNDSIIGAKDKDFRQPNDIYRVSALWLTNSRGEVLLAQRSFSNDNDPGKWGPAVAGTVEQGETYESNIIKEIAEEIGLNIPLAALKKGPKTFREKPERKYFCQWYIYQTDKSASEFNVQRSEVEKVQWFDRETVKKMVAEKPDNFLQIIRQWANGKIDFSSR